MFYTYKLLYLQVFEMTNKRWCTGRDFSAPSNFEEILNDDFDDFEDEEPEYLVSIYYIYNKHIVALYKDLLICSFDFFLLYRLQRDKVNQNVPVVLFVGILWVVFCVFGFMGFTHDALFFF